MSIVLHSPSFLMRLLVSLVLLLGPLGLAGRGTTPSPSPHPRLVASSDLEPASVIAAAADSEDSESEVKLLLAALGSTIGIQRPASGNTTTIDSNPRARRSTRPATPSRGPPTA